MWDRESSFSWEQPVTATGVSSDVFESSEKDIATGRHLTLQVMTGKYTGGGSMKVGVMTGDNEDRSGGVELASYDISAESLAEGGPVLAAALPTGCRKYIWLAYTVTGTLADGTVSAGLMLDGQTNNPSFWRP